MFERTLIKADHKKLLSELLPSESIESILKRPKVHTFLTRLEALIPQDHIRTYYQPLLHQFLLYCQALPESTNHYYAEKGGLVEFALLRCEIALSLFTHYFVKDEEGKLSDVQHCWQYALFSASLLYGIGKLFLDYEVQLYDKRRHYIETWNPLLGETLLSAPYYTYHVDNQSQLYFRKRLNIMFAQVLMPRVGLNWLCQYPDILEAWLTLLEEDKHGVRILSAILFYAESLALMQSIEQMLLRLNAIKAKSLRTFEQNQIDELNEKAGLQFLYWLRQQLEHGELVLNEAPLQLTDEGLLLQDEVFKEFVKDFPAYKNWQAVKQGFLSLAFHDNNVNTAEVLFAQFGIILPSKAMFSFSQFHQRAWISAIEIIDFALGGRMTPGMTLEHITKSSKLNPKGQWVQQEPTPRMKMGQSHRG